MSGQLHLFNNVTTPVEVVARSIKRLFLTPGVGREEWARSLLAINPAIKIAMYRLHHTAQTGPNPDNNQVLRAGEWAEMFKANPNLPLRYADGKIVDKIGSKKPAVLIDFTQRDWQEKHIVECAMRASGQYRDLYTWLGWDDGSTVQRVYGGGDIVTKQFGKSQPTTDDKFFKAFKAWAAFARRNIAMPMGLAFGTNLQSPREFLPLYNLLAAEFLKKEQGVTQPGFIMTEFPWIKYDGKAFDLWNWETTRQKAQTINRLWGEHWGVIQVDPKDANRKEGDAYERFRLALYSFALFDTGSTYLRVAPDGNYSGFTSVPEIDDVLETRFPATAAKGEATLFAEDVWQRMYTGDRYIRVYAKENRVDIHEPPVVIDTPPELEIIEDQKHVAGTRVGFWVNGKNIARLEITGLPAGIEPGPPGGYINGILEPVEESTTTTVRLLAFSPTGLKSEISFQWTVEPIPKPEPQKFLMRYISVNAQGEFTIELHSVP